MEVLKEYAEEISNKYAKIDIGLTIQNFKSGINTKEFHDLHFNDYKFGKVY